jgi:hypothetical protein
VPQAEDQLDVSRDRHGRENDQPAAWLMRQHGYGCFDLTGIVNGSECRLYLEEDNATTSTDRRYST